MGTVWGATAVSAVDGSHSGGGGRAQHGRHGPGTTAGPPIRRMIPRPTVSLIRPRGPAAKARPPHPTGPVMALADWIFGRRLATREEEHQRIGVLAGIPMLGLDA